MKWALSIPLLDGQIYGQIRKKLIDALGGRFKEVIIGGAAMNPEVEEFFHRIKFPFTIGYGMTECAPLISYAPWNEFVPTSSGRVLDIMEARIYKENPDDKLGEIQVRGENVMTGYYKNPEATKEVFTEDGWLPHRRLGYTGRRQQPIHTRTQQDHDSQFQWTEYLPRRDRSTAQQHAFRPGKSCHRTE